MKIEINTVKGFQDFLPPESLKREAVRKVVEKWFKRYGFLPVETPIVEYDELMKGDSLPSEGEDAAVSERFRLQDRGGRNLGLRYEFTFQLARIFDKNPNIKLPFRRFQIGEVFRDEPVSQVRFRQFTQCDADVIGDESANADAECLALFAEILKELKVKTEIQVNNRKLLTSIIESVQISRVKNVMRELDKIEKVGFDEVKSNLRKWAGLNQIVTMFKIFEKDMDFFRKNAFQGVDEIEELIETCKQYGLKVKFNPFLVRGLGYYTGNIFEIREAGGKNSIAGGGRYDKTVGKYLTKNIPAVGISFGLERLTELADVKVGRCPEVLVLSISQDLIAMKLAQKLRKEGVSCVVDFRKPGKALEYANALGIPNVVFVGEEEVGKKKYKLKNMRSGKEQLLGEGQLMKKVCGVR
ncbi:MAG: histidine--tRNA ligase [Nanoarchaeota archaeon]|nr:histidine--tRNA ligase [Nanoarchaeota archaeon]MBU1103099.1 histidine--tRNA ligase [Nanoarchaeota archaeon]